MFKSLFRVAINCPRNYTKPKGMIHLIASRGIERLKHRSIQNSLECMGTKRACSHAGSGKGRSKNQEELRMRSTDHEPSWFAIVVSTWLIS